MAGINKSNAEEKHRIIIVDDDEDCALTLTHILRADYDIDHYFSADDALKNIGKTKFSLVLMDIGMKGMNGIEALKRIRAEKEYTDIPVIALTAYAMMGDRERFLKEGFNYYVSKPFRNKEVKDLIDGILSGSS